VDAERLGVEYVRRDDGAALLRVSGRLEHATAAVLEGVLQALGSEPAHIVLDLTAVDHIDSHGLDVLLEADASAGRRGATVEVIGIQESLLARRSRLDQPE
jgi:anti-anti-sigma factor